MFEELFKGLREELVICSVEEFIRNPLGELYRDPIKELNRDPIEKLNRNPIYEIIHRFVKGARWRKADKKDVRRSHQKNF